MYQPGVNYLGSFTDILQSVLSTGERIFTGSRLPAPTDPRLRLPTTPPFIDPRTGAYMPASDYTVPLMVGGGILALLLLSRRRRA